MLYLRFTLAIFTLIHFIVIRQALLFLTKSKIYINFVFKGDMHFNKKAFGNMKVIPSLAENMKKHIRLQNKQ